MGSEFLFVYGTLKKGFNNRARKKLKENSLFVGDAEFNGKLFRINGYPGAIKSNNSSDIVYGELYKIKNHVSVFKILDEFEECSDTFDKPALFKRKICKVRIEKKYEYAWIYLYNLATRGLPKIKTGKFMQADK
ncbi:MAG: gamma-glutamylcyclotransferase [Candidatus Marsarchaeota archaeon]|nr:gamma-glutamylcyclotransferase [Candidatus Marsarchaeota archaeon]MCL5094652.1 gamma-glutamylcyclotransferase [Candidatus Marsarchaeota archaeon]